MQCMHYIPSHLIMYICNSVGMAMSTCIFLTYLYLICCKHSLLRTSLRKWCINPIIMIIIIIIIIII